MSDFGMDEFAECGVCGGQLQIVRPGKYQCPQCETARVIEEYKTETEEAKRDYATMLDRSAWWMKQAETAQAERDEARRERDIAQVRLARLILISSQPIEVLETEQEYNERILSEMGDVLAQVKEAVS